MSFARLFAAALCCALMVPLASWATGHDPRIGAEVAPFPAAGVTLSSTRYETFVSYRVRVVNGARNDLNRVSFNASTSVIGAATNTSQIDPVLVGISGVAGPCTQPSGPTSLECPVGAGASLKPGQSAEFWVVVRTPNAGQTLRFTGVFGGYEGKGRGNGCCDQTIVVDTPLIDPLAGDAAFKTELFTFVRSSGGTYFTGVDGFPTKDDPWTTTVAVPTVTNGVFGLPFTTAAVQESVDLQSCSSVNLQCNRTRLTVPGTFNSLLITLRQHPSIIGDCANINQWRIAYSPQPEVQPYVELQRCSVTGGPTPGVPCIESCQEYSKKSWPAVPKSAWGVFECKIRALDNGGYKVQ